VVGYFFYYEIGGNQYGPRFFFEALPFLVLFVVRQVWNSKEKWATALLCAGMLYMVVKIPFIADREHRVIVERKDVYRLVGEQSIINAVVFLSSHTGIMRPMPTGDLTRNDVRYQNDVLYVRDIPASNQELMDYYPGRTFYKYVRKPEEVKGALVRMK
jgi:hypothetical protein